MAGAGLVEFTICINEIWLLQLVPLLWDFSVLPRKKRLENEKEANLFLQGNIPQIGIGL